MLNRILAVAVLAAASVAPLTRATAADASPAATYAARTANWGTLTVTAPTASYFVVMGEQANGSYLPVASGTISGTGSASVCVPHSGPTNNNQPQYMVQVTLSDGSQLVLLAGGEGHDDNWWLD